MSFNGNTIQRFSILAPIGVTVLSNTFKQSMALLHCYRDYQFKIPNGKPVHP